MKKEPKPKTDKRSCSLYCSDAQLEYFKWWLKAKGNVPEKPWGVKK